MSKKKSSQWICPKMLQNNRKAYFGSMWLTFGEKQFLLIFIPFYRFYWKQLLKQIQNFLRIFRFSNMVTKTNFLSISVLVSEIATFMSKKKSSLWISPKMHQNKIKAQFSSIWHNLWRNFFFLIFIFYYIFFQKKLVKQIQIFHRIFPFSNMVKKQTF